MDEWFKSHAWKACVGLSLPGVRIPPSPPELSFKQYQETPKTRMSPSEYAGFSFQDVPEHSLTAQVFGAIFDGIPRYR